ncbi:hypothetical protein ACCO45_008868 [Purpureocillium lilacinum]|uniref:Uncharacterized protein n=1 Tax=Purpureocillium lilacinum TaxID=33203 RepID=A0ACC4DIS2_PURLI
MVPFGGGGGRRRNWYSEAALGLGNSNPFLLHIFIAVALLHDMHLASASANSSSSTGDAAAAAQRARLAFHWYHGTALFQRQLASVTAVMSACNYDGSKAPSSSARDALWVAAALLGAAAYADVGSGGEIPDSTDERPGARDSRMTRRTKTQGKPQRQRQRHLVWPLRPGSHPSDLDWLKLGHGKTAVWHVADPSRPESVFHRLGESLARDPPPDGHLPVDWDALPPLFARRASDRNVSRFLTFVAQLPAPFRRLLERRDPRALLLLAYWHAKVARRPSWWVRRRSVVEGLAICDYLAGPRCCDAAGPDVVALLEWPRRELLEVQARDTTCW